MKNEKDVSRGKTPLGGALAAVKERVPPFLEQVRSFAEQKDELIRTLVLPVAYALLFSSQRVGTVVAPFGICAVCAARQGVPAAAVLLAAIISTLTGDDFVPTAAAVGLCFVVSAGARLLKRDFSSAVRAATAAVAGLALTFVLSLQGGIVLYELCMLALAAALYPVLTLALSDVFAGGEHTSPAGFGVCALAFTAAYTLAGIGGVFTSVGVLFSMTASLYTSYAYGTYRGIAVGVACGLAADPAAGLVYAVAAATSGLLMEVSPMAAVAVGTVFATAVGVAGGGANVLGDMFPEFMLCAAITGPLFQYGIIPMPRRSTVREEEDDDASVGGMRARSIKKRASAIAAGFASAGAFMGRLTSATAKPSASELRQTCDEAFDAYCASCTHRDTCWDEEYSETAASIGKTVKAIRDGKRITASVLTPAIRERCPHSDGIIARINAGVTACAKNGAASGTGIYADEYESVSQILTSMMEEDEGDFSLDRSASAKLARKLASLGVRAREVKVYGGRCKRVFASGLEGGCKAGNDDVKVAAETVLGTRLTSPEYSLSGGTVTMSMTSVPKYKVTAGKSLVAKVSGRCGDTVSCFSGDGGYYYAVLSDGMGSGGEAALASGTSVSLLEKLLGAGCRLSSVLGMLNGVLLRRSTECFATLDVMEIDLLTGVARFIKSGAAPSFVLRDGRLYRLASATIPVGIMDVPDAEKLTFDVCSGDVVVMLSDGIIGGDEDDAWLLSLLSGEGGEPSLLDGKTPAQAANDIAAAAELRFGRRDDISVCVARIERV